MDKGKNFSCNNVGQRKKSDFYETPYCLTIELLKIVKLKEPILEPACGNKAIVKILLKKYNDIDFYDIKDNITNKEDIVICPLKHKIGKECGKFDDCKVCPLISNFLMEVNEYKTIITNPPYSLAFEFIQKAKLLCGDLYLLLPLAYLHGKQRLDYIYSDKSFQLNCIYVFDRYPMLGEKLRKDGKIHTGMMVYAWYHFSKKPEYKEPLIRFIDIQKYILSRKDE
jgi:hypothetical protein